MSNIRSYEDRRPLIAGDAWIDKTAVVIGEVVIGPAIRRAGRRWSAERSGKTRGRADEGSEELSAVEGWRGHRLEFSGTRAGWHEFDRSGRAI